MSKSKSLQDKELENDKLPGNSEAVSLTAAMASDALSEGESTSVFDPAKSVRSPVVGFVPLFFNSKINAVRVPILYPPSHTDQLHAASLAELVRQGQGTVSENELTNFDFSDGRDDGREAHSMYELEWADPAERYEAEQRVNAAISAEIKSQLKRLSLIHI